MPGPPSPHSHRGQIALRSIGRDHFAKVANGAYIASVTSSDDELELQALDGLYERTSTGEHITRYARTDHYFYVLAGGNAVNFLHGACVGAFIFLVQAESLATLGALPEHWHADFRWALWAKEPKVVLQAEEVDGYAWRPSTNAPTPKLAAKLAGLRPALALHPQPPTVACGRGAGRSKCSMP